MLINNINVLIIFVIVFSSIFGISMQIKNNIKSKENLIMYLYSIIILYKNLVLLSAYVSLINISRSNFIIIIHFTLIIINTIYISNNVNMMNIIMLIVIIDIISVLNVIIVNKGEGIWYYFLYQSLMTIIIWNSLVIFNNNLISVIYYYKLGSGIGGYYIPDLYNSIINKNINIMIYVGICNIILMYSPIMLFLPNDNKVIILINVLLIVLILVSWIYKGYVFINMWLYGIGFSTMILANIYYIFVTVDHIYYNLYNYIYYFTLTSIIIWYVFLLSLYVLVNNNSKNIVMLSIIGVNNDNNNSNNSNSDNNNVNKYKYKLLLYNDYSIIYRYINIILLGIFNSIYRIMLIYIIVNIIIVQYINKYKYNINNNLYSIYNKYINSNIIK